MSSSQKTTASNRHKPCRTGFYKSWKANGFDQRVLAKLEDVVTASGVESSAFTFYVSGALLRKQRAGGPCISYDSCHAFSWSAA